VRPVTAPVGRKLAIHWSMNPDTWTAPRLMAMGVKFRPICRTGSLIAVAPPWRVRPRANGHWTPSWSTLPATDPHAR